MGEAYIKVAVQNVFSYKSAGGSREEMQEERGGGVFVARHVNMQVSECA